MKKLSIILIVSFLSQVTLAGNIEKTFHISNPVTKTIGQYQTVTLDKAVLSGIPGEPTLPYMAVSLMLPPGESAESIEVIRENEVILTGSYLLFPKQDVIPLSKKSTGTFLRNEAVYGMNGNYPASPTGHLLTQYLNGFAFALSTFTPLNYNPATGKVSYFKDVTIRIKTRQDQNSVNALRNLTSSKDALNRVRAFAQNQEMINQYPAAPKSPAGYQILIITPFTFEDGFNDLVNYYSSIGLTSQFESVEDINSGVSGYDLPEKIRNYIRQEYQNNGIEYVIIGGTESLVPSRDFYDIVYYGTGGVEEESYDIPTDLYYCALDGSDDANGNHIYGEVADSTDLLPDLAVGRLPFTTAADQASMIHKSVSYQANPVLGEDNRPLFAGEYLYGDPLTFGGDFMNLLIDNHNDNGYFSFGVPSGINDITRLYDTLNADSVTYWQWSSDSLIALINQGTSFIHHLGHANTSYMLRMDISQITDTNFYLVNGVDHNYSLVYTQGCDDGGYDNSGCIASQSLAIDNFAVAGIFNTRFGWFDQGTTDGPSEHLQRQFVSALFNDTLPENHIGKDQMISKIQTAPWVGLPGEFEPGAQRWTQYDCVLLGDPALYIRTSGPVAGIQNKSNNGYFSLYPNPAKGYVKVSYSLPENSDVTFQIINTSGQQVGKSYSLKDETSGDHLTDIEFGDLSTGIYFCRMITKTASLTKKLVVIN
ncbi:MAG: C25 family cysteine peptidase [Bacteroidales bacterium]|jgi:hypothetical protein